MLFVICITPEKKDSRSLSFYYLLSMYVVTKIVVGHGKYGYVGERADITKLLEFIFNNCCVNATPKYCLKHND